MPCKLSSHCVWKYQFGFNWCYFFLIADYEARGPYTFMFRLERNWKQQQSTRKSQYFNRTMTRQGRLCGLQATQRASQVWGALTWGWGHTVRLCPTTAALHTQPRPWDNRWEHSSCGRTAASSPDHPAATRAPRWAQGWASSTRSPNTAPQVQKQKSLTEPENSAGSYLTAWRSTALSLHIYIGGKKTDLHEESSSKLSPSLSFPLHF